MPKRRTEEVYTNRRKKSKKEQLYSIKDIIDEDETRYLIDWEDDSDTKEKFEPTWQSKSVYVTKDAIDAWEQQKVRKQSIPSIPKPRSSSSKLDSDIGSSSPPRLQRRRNRIIRSPSSSINEEPLGTDAGGHQTSSAESDFSDIDRLIPESGEPHDTAIVQLSALHSSFPRDQYSTWNDASAQETLPSQNESNSLSKDSQVSLLQTGSNLYASSFVVLDSQLSQELLSSALHSLSPSSPAPATSQFDFSSQTNSYEAEALTNANRTIVIPSSQPVVSSYSRLSSPNQSLAPYNAGNEAFRGLEYEEISPTGASDYESPSQGIPTFQTQIPIALTYSASQSLVGSTLEEWRGTQVATGKSPSINTASTLDRFEQATPEITSQVAASNLLPWSIHQIRPTFSPTNIIQGHTSSPQSWVLIQRDPNSQSTKSPNNTDSSAIDSKASTQSDNAVNRPTAGFAGHRGSAQPPSPERVKESTASDFIPDTDMSHRPVTPVIHPSTMGNSPNSPRSHPPASLSPGLPMQDRVREIRALPPVNINTRRANAGSDSPLGSTSPSNVRSPSNVPEPSPHSLGQARLEVQSADIPNSHKLIQIHTNSTEDSSNGSFSNVSTTSSKIVELTDLGLGPMEFPVPLPLPARVRDQYGLTVQFFSKAVKSFLEGDDNAERAFLNGEKDQPLIVSMNKMISRLNNISTHIDLENETSQTQSEKEIPPETEAKWAASSSSKFQFLQFLFEKLRGHKIHVAIVANGQHLQIIVERFLIGLHANYRRSYPGGETTPGEGYLLVTIVAPGSPIPVEGVMHASLVVAMDTSFNASDPYVLALRCFPGRAGYLSAVVHPLVYCSSEHIARCMNGLPILATELDRLKATVKCITDNESYVGVLDREEHKTDACAEEVYHFVTEMYGQHATYWEVFGMRPIKVKGIEVIVEPSQDTESSQPSEDVVDLSDLPAARKRTQEDVAMEDGGSSKRKRLSEAPDDVLVSQNMDALIRYFRQALDKAEASLHENGAAHEARVATLEASLAEKDQITAGKEQCIAEHMDALSDLQTRFEKRTRTYHELRHRSNDMTEALEKSERKREALAASNDKLREESRRLQEELREAREKLANSAVPEVAKLEEMEAEMRRLRQEKASLERRVESAASDFRFTSQQYQIASSSAAESAGKVQDLETENAALQRKAASGAAKLREANNRTEAEIHLAHLEKALTENEELKEQLRRQGKERGRGMTTRTGSVAPRSPGLRSGGSPGPARSRAGSRAPLSRPGSPPRGLFHGRKPRSMMVEQ